MARSKLYFYLTLLFILIRFYFNTKNPLLNIHFHSIIKLIIVCSIINAIILIISVIFADKSIKHARDKEDWIRKASKFLPFILLIVIILHILSSLSTFDVLF